MSTATSELRRFLVIAGRRLRNGQSAAEMFSPAVDAVWHQMLGTPQYQALCRETAGRPIGHAANKGQGPISWVTAYEEAYGPLPEIWFTDAEGRLDHEAIARYRATGTVVAEWDCSPIGGGGDDDLVPETDRR
ncbi:hypothetical protein [Streptomyces palmae]|uniref:Uncharacterized protein n=1 Tax=Streptomyces palmae TaxID=1701085 RepID=A0A4Z0GYQ3_9ACTN|nr:hypothetical protein [Streptomyces palmae]TGB03008.1 hypothetical protein E4099_20250 [Streptomyces palmae]